MLRKICGAAFGGGCCGEADTPSRAARMSPRDTASLLSQMTSISFLAQNGLGHDVFQNDRADLLALGMRICLHYSCSPVGPRSHVAAATSKEQRANVDWYREV